MALHSQKRYTNRNHKPSEICVVRIQHIPVQMLCVQHIKGSRFYFWVFTWFNLKLFDSSVTDSVSNDSIDTVTNDGVPLGHPDDTTTDKNILGYFDRLYRSKYYDNVALYVVLILIKLVFSYLMWQTFWLYSWYNYFLQVIVLLKSMFQFEILPWNQKAIPANMPFTAPRIIGIERKTNYALYDLLLLLIIFLHR